MREFSGTARLANFEMILRYNRRMFVENRRRTEQVVLCSIQLRSNFFHWQNS